MAYLPSQYPYYFLRPLYRDIQFVSERALMTIPISTQHLQITFSIREYLPVVHGISKSQLIHPNTEPIVTAYWKNLPNYLIARCPLCGASYTEKIDTHSLYYWHIRPDKDSYVFTSEHQQIGCRHFVAVHSFINLNDYHQSLNTEMQPTAFYNDSGDIPFVIPDLLPNTLPTIAVIHALPICAIEGNAFVPRYALYMITYYAEDSKRVKEYRCQKLKPGPDDYMLLLEFPDFMRRHPESADLQQWVKRGKLQWLDPNSADLSLRAEPLAAFPYASITGFGQKYTYRPNPVTVPTWAFWRKRRLREGGRIELR